MPSIQVYHRDENNEETLVACIDGDLIKHRSKTIRDLIATRSPALIHKVTLFGPTFDALAFVLTQITEAHNKKKPLDIVPGSRGLLESLHIHRAILCLQIEPEQIKVPTHIIGYLAHNLIAPDEMVLVYEAYSSIDNSHGKLFTTMLSTTAWKIANKELSVDQITELKAAAETISHLDEVLTAKILEVKKMVRVQAIIAKKKAAKDEKRRAAEVAAATAWADDAGW